MESSSMMTKKTHIVVIASGTGRCSPLLFTSLITYADNMLIFKYIMQAHSIGATHICVYNLRDVIIGYDISPNMDWKASLCRDPDKYK